MPVRSKKSNTKPKEKTNIDFSNLENIILTVSQSTLVDKIIKSRITCISGFAGTSKTFTSCYAALTMLADGIIKKIILTKPIKEAGEPLGHLPGTVDEKVAPYMESFILTMNELIGDFYVKQLIETGVIEIRPLAYLRGSTFKGCCMVMDESQNCTFKDLMLYVTRLGKNSKIIIAGDVSQYDIERKKVKLPEFMQMIKGIKGVEEHIFSKEDIVRDKILIDIADRYEEYRRTNNLD